MVDYLGVMPAASTVCSVSPAQSSAMMEQIDQHEPRTHAAHEQLTPDDESLEVGAPPAR